MLAQGLNSIIRLSENKKHELYMLNKRKMALNIENDKKRMEADVIIFSMFKLYIIIR